MFLLWWSKRCTHKKKKKMTSQFDTLTETHCVGKWPSERRGMSSEVLLEKKVSTLRKESEALVKRSVMVKFVPSSKIIKCQDLPEECATKRSRSLKRTSVSDVFFFICHFSMTWELLNNVKFYLKYFFLVTFWLYWLKKKRRKEIIIHQKNSLNFMI